MPTTNTEHVSTIPPKDSLGTEIIIALMGVTGKIQSLLEPCIRWLRRATGSGKSYFVREVSGNSEVEVSGDLYSCTSKVKSYSFEYGGARITLVDTPGFNDTNRSDMEVLKEITDWTSESYRKERLLSGIIYLHPITHTRLEGSALKNLRMFRNLCGQKVLGNVFLTTTQWSNVNLREAELRENRLRSQDFWGGLIGKGATLQRFHGTRESGLELIHKLMSNIPKPLDIQDQIVKQNMTLLETSAGKCINEELIAQEKRHKEEVESLEKERQEAINAKDDEMNKILAEEQAKVQKKLEKAAAEKKLLAELHAAEVRKREEEERKRQEEMARREKSVIAVATEDISVIAHIHTFLGGYLTRGRWIFDINNHEEFESNTFAVEIQYHVKILSGVEIPVKTLRELSGEGMGKSNYIFVGEVRYVCKSRTPIKRGGRHFVIFRKG
ncbi:hypothetical protein B9Z19DRAFT_1001545 [Tuber borchii]|uniref:G domain-containing protein n=1 Tax=Tuber borchii TaxID=42251 RepID=A0A2T6ZFB7_TUBBO|nr:hypothetical protein B9Z19DRAFT_1001545 [Tuber borchii]